MDEKIDMRALPGPPAERWFCRYSIAAEPWVPRLMERETPQLLVRAMRTQFNGSPFITIKRIFMESR